MDADIVCVGFGPATAGFLTTLSKQLVNADGTPAVESAVMPGMPPQVLCYERADDIGFGVSGVVTRARALRASFPEIKTAGIPMAAPVGEEKVLYLLDPLGASRRSLTLRLADALIRATKFALPFENHALNLPWTPAFLHKHDGMILSMGQFMQWVGAQVQSTGTVQIWPGTPVAEALIENQDQVGRVTPCAPGSDECEIGARGATRPTQKSSASACSIKAWTKKAIPPTASRPAWTFTPRSRSLATARSVRLAGSSTNNFGLPDGKHTRDWAVGMKFVVDLPEDTHAQSRHRAAHVRLSRAGDFRFSLRPSRPRRVARHFCAVVVRQPGAHGLPLSPALDAASVSLALSQGRQAPLVGRQDARRIRQARRAAPHRRRLRAHRRRQRHHERPHRLRRGRSLGHRHATRRGRPRIAQGQKAVHQAKPR